MADLGETFTGADVRARVNERLEKAGGTVEGDLIMGTGTKITTPLIETDIINDSDGVTAIEIDKESEKVSIYGQIINEKTYITPTTYNENINANTTITKTIAIGDSKKFGKIIINQVSSSAPNYFLGGIMIDISTDINNAIISGSMIYDGKLYPAVWSKNKLTQITKKLDNYYSYGLNATYNSTIEIISCYIDGTDLKIVFKNTNISTSVLLGCLVEGYVY